MGKAYWIVMAAAAAGFTGLAAPEASAGKRDVQRFELVSPIRSPDEDAEGSH